MEKHSMTIFSICHYTNRNPITYRYSKLHIHPYATFVR